MAGRKSSAWTESEIRFLRENYIELSLDRLIAGLYEIGGKWFSKQQISNKKRDLGLFTYIDNNGFVITPQRVYTFRASRRRAAFSYSEISLPGGEAVFAGCLLVPPYKFFAATSFAVLIKDITDYYRKYAKRSNARFIDDQDWDSHHRKTKCTKRK